MKNTSFSSVWPAFPFTLCRLAVFLLLSSFSSSPFTSTFSLGVGILGVHAAAYDLLPGDPAFIYDQGWHVPPEWNTTGNADAANGFNLTNITRIGTINSGFHLTFQGSHICIYGSENMTVEAWINGLPVELSDAGSSGTTTTTSTSSNWTSLTNSTKLWGKPLKTLSLDSDGGTYQLYLRVNGATPDTTADSTTEGSGSNTDGSDDVNNVKRADGIPDYYWFGGLRISTSLPAVEPAFYGVNANDSRHDRDHDWGSLATTTYMGFPADMQESTYNVSDGWNWIRQSYVTKNESTIWSATAGTKMEVIFNGTAFWLFATLAPYTSVANISIDWTERTVLNMTYPELATPILGGLMWSKTELIPGTHCVRMQVLEGRVDFNFVRMVGHPVDPDQFYASFANATTHIPGISSTPARSNGLELWQIVIVSVVPSLFLAAVAFAIYARRMKKLRSMPQHQDTSSSEAGILDEQKSNASSAPVSTFLRNAPGRGDLPTISTTPGLGLVVPFDLRLANTTGSLESPNDNGSGNLAYHLGHGPARRKGGLGIFGDFGSGGVGVGAGWSPVDRERDREDNSSLTYPDTIDDLSDIRPLDYSHPSHHSPVHINVGDHPFRSGELSNGNSNGNGNGNGNSGGNGSGNNHTSNRTDSSTNPTNPTREDERRRSPANRSYQVDHHDQHDQHDWAAPPPSYPGLALSRNGSLLFTVRNEDGEYEEYSSSGIDPIYGDGRPRISIEKHVFGFGGRIARNANVGVGGVGGDVDMEVASPSTSTGTGAPQSPQLQLSREDLARLVNRIAQLRVGAGVAGPSGSGGNGGNGGSGSGRNRGRRRDGDSSADEGDGASSTASAGDSRDGRGSGSGGSRRGSGMGSAVAVAGLAEDGDRSLDGHGHGSNSDHGHGHGSTEHEEVDPNDPVEALARQLVEMERTLWDDREHEHESDPTTTTDQTYTRSTNPTEPASDSDSSPLGGAGNGERRGLVGGVDDKDRKDKDRDRDRGDDATVENTDTTRTDGS